MLDELDIVVFRDVALTIVSDTIHHCYTKILYRAQQILKHENNHVYGTGKCISFAGTLYPMRYLHTALLLVSLMSWER